MKKKILLVLALVCALCLTMSVALAVGGMSESCPDCGSPAYFGYQNEYCCVLECYQCGYTEYQDHNMMTVSENRMSCLYCDYTVYCDDARGIISQDTGFDGAQVYTASLTVTSDKGIISYSPSISYWGEVAIPSLYYDGNKSMTSAPANPGTHTVTMEAKCGDHTYSITKSFTIQGRCPKCYSIWDGYHCYNCGYDPNAPQHVHVTLNAHDLTVDAAAIGKTYKLSATTSAYTELTWASTDWGVVGVNYDGTLIFNAPGTASVYVYTSTKDYDVCRITVQAPVTPKPVVTPVPTPVPTNVPVSIELSDDSVELDMASDVSYKIDADVVGTKSKAKWTSSDKNVVTVSSTGKVTVKGVGTATITATVEGKSATCKVTVVGPCAEIEEVEPGKKAGTLIISLTSDFENMKSFEVQYRLDGASSWKKKTVTAKNGDAKLTLSNLKPGKLYEVKTRASFKLGGKNLKTEWSDVISEEAAD